MLLELHVKLDDYLSDKCCEKRANDYDVSSCKQALVMIESTHVCGLSWIRKNGNVLSSQLCGCPYKPFTWQLLESKKQPSVMFCHKKLHFLQQIFVSASRICTFYVFHFFCLSCFVIFTYITHSCLQMHITEISWRVWVQQFSFSLIRISEN